MVAVLYFPFFMCKFKETCDSNCDKLLYSKQSLLLILEHGSVCGSGGGEHELVSLGAGMVIDCTSHH